MKKLYCIASVSILLCLFASVSYSSVTGMAKLSGKSDNSGIMVHFQAQSFSSVDDTAYTNSDGSFSHEIKGGVYIVIFSKNGYQEKMYQDGQKIALAENDTLSAVTLEQGNTSYVQGNVQGTWTNDKVYVATGDITVAQPSSLYIMPGTVIKFNGKFNFNVYGSLKAIGSKDQPITFTSNLSNPKMGDWKGFYVQSSDVVLDKCIIEKCVIAVNCSGFSPYIINSEIRDFTDCGVYSLTGSPIIKNNRIHDYVYELSPYSQAVWIQNESNAEVECNVIYNGGGYGIYTSSDIKISNNIIWKIRNLDRGFGIATTNWSKAILQNNYIDDCNVGFRLTSNSTPMIVNNTIGKCDSGVVMTSTSIPKIINNIIYRCKHGISQFSNPNPALDDISSNLFFLNDTNFINVEITGIGKIVTKNNQGYDCDSYFNLFTDPKFLDNVPPILDSVSPCLKSGDTRYSKMIGFNTAVVCTPATEVEYIKSTQKDQISPNPASDYIEISVRENGRLPLQNEIRIYDVFGQIQTTPSLRDTPPNQGGEKVKIDVSGLLPGVYFVKIGDKVSKFMKI